MIIGKQKSLAEIRDILAPYHKVLVLGCGTCTTICFAGGEREVAILASALRLGDKKNGVERQIDEFTVQRQCEWEFLDEAADRIKNADATLSLACGVGCQGIAERFPKAVSLPGVDTYFKGIPQEMGVWSSRCLGCGSCVLALTGGICPITRCAKSMLNGPCGGSSKGRCEVQPDRPCGWQLIYDKLANLGKLDTLEEVRPPKDWSTSHSGGPHTIVRPDLRLPDAAASSKVTDTTIKEVKRFSK